MVTCWEHSDLIDERSSPRRVAVHVPVTSLPLRGGGEHACGFPALRVDLDHAGNVELQALSHSGPVCLVLHEHGADGVIRVPLPSDLGFGCCRVQVLVD